nr:hypothetical protein [uncultured Carboxylicivirga sp.]
MKTKLTSIAGLISTIIAISLLQGCSSCQQDKSQPEIGEGINLNSINLVDSIETVITALPSPEEVIQYIKSNDVNFDPDLLVPTKMSILLTSLNSKKQLLGMYLADLAYLSSFSRTDYISDLLKTIDNLMKDLELTPVVSEDMRTMILESSYTPNDVYTISQELYDSVINYLYDIDDGKTLTLISIGTFYEVMYITTNIHNNYDLYISSINKIGEQKFIYTDLLEMSKSFREKGLSEEYEDLLMLEQPFKNINYQSKIVDSYTTEDSVLYIKSLSTTDMSSKKYDEFCYIINHIRNKLVTFK